MIAQPKALTGKTARRWTQGVHINTDGHIVIDADESTPENPQPLYVIRPSEYHGGAIEFCRYSGTQMLTVVMVIPLAKWTHIFRYLPIVMAAAARLAKNAAVAGQKQQT